MFLLEMILVKKYINQVVEIIYMDRNGKITQRSIHIHAIRNGLVRATCLQTGAPRAFRNEQILALRPVKHSALHPVKQPGLGKGGKYHAS